MAPCAVHSASYQTLLRCMLLWYTSLTAWRASQTDPEAAKAVFESGVPVTMVPLEVRQPCFGKRSGAARKVFDDLCDTALPPENAQNLSYLARAQQTPRALHPSENVTNFSAFQAIPFLSQGSCPRVSIPAHDLQRLTVVSVDQECPLPDISESIRSHPAV